MILNIVHNLSNIMKEYDRLKSEASVHINSSREW